jgi:hypothetical protein
MKLSLLIAILLTLAAPQAFAGLSAAVPDGETEGRSGDVDMCQGACVKDQNQVNFTTSPYEVDKKINEILQVPGTVKPQDLEHGEGKKEKSWDI